MTAGNPTKIKFFYEKGKYFRVAHVDGAIGGLTPARSIFVALFSQRSALPQTVEQQITPEGKLGTVIETMGKHGIFREMEIGIVVTPEVAEELAAFLQQHARAARETMPKNTASAGKIQ